MLSCLQGRSNYSVPAYDYWRPIFVHALEEAGHEVLEVPGVDWAEGMTYPHGTELDSWRARTWDAVVAHGREERRRGPIDLFIGYLYPGQVEPSAIHELQSRGTPCVNFFCDNVREFRRVPTEYRAFALHWVPEFEALPIYAAAGLDFVHAPMPFWLPSALRVPPLEETEPPTFIGSADVLRSDLLARALRAGADFVVRGRGWRQDELPERSQSRLPLARSIAFRLSVARERGPVTLVRWAERRLRPLRPVPLPERYLGEPCPGDEYYRVLRGAMVALGINRVPSLLASDRRPLTYSRLRDIEAPMLGACYLTEWTPGLERLYDLGNEIETYRTAEELAAKLSELRADPKRRMSMRGRAQRRALAEHSVARSIELIAARLGMKSAA
jgi:hypothetical protein